MARRAGLCNALARRRPSRDNSNEYRDRRPGRITANCRDGRSADAPGLARPACYETRSGLHRVREFAWALRSHRRKGQPAANSDACIRRPVCRHALQSNRRYVYPSLVRRRCRWQSYWRLQTFRGPSRVRIAKFTVVAKGTPKAGYRLNA